MWNFLIAKLQDRCDNYMVLDFLCVFWGGVGYATKPESLHSSYTTKQHNLHNIINLRLILPKKIVQCAICVKFQFKYVFYCKERAQMSLRLWITLHVLKVKFNSLIWPLMIMMWAKPSSAPWHLLYLSVNKSKQNENFSQSKKCGIQSPDLVLRAYTKLPLVLLNPILNLIHSPNIKILQD